MDFIKMEVFVNNSEVKFTRKEFAILEYFINRVGEVVHRHELLNNIWGYNKTPTTRTVDTFILEIRKKLKKYLLIPNILLALVVLGISLILKFNVFLSIFFNN